MQEKKEINIEIGARIKAEREKVGLTQERFSELIGLGPKSVSAFERGTVGISFVTLKKICRVLSVSSDQILFGQPEQSKNDLDELTAFIAETGRGRFSDPNTVAKVIQTAARGSYRLPKTVNDTVNQAMSVSIASIRALKEQIKVLDKAIEQQFEIIPNTLTSIPGIGKVYSAGIIAEIGDIHRFDSQASVAKFAGLVWTQHQSGEFEAEHSQMIKSGNRYLRYYLLEAANSVRRCDSEFRRYYDLKFKEVNKYQHKRALALTARKLVRLVFRLLKDNRLYTPPEG